MHSRLVDDDQDVVPHAITDPRLADAVKHSSLKPSPLIVTVSPPVNAALTLLAKLDTGAADHSSLLRSGSRLQAGTPGVSTHGLASNS
jgi:hypothetical protein